jgi:hypothetical protein
MSSSEFQKVLVRDERLDCHPAIPFAVYKSGQNVTVAEFNAISQSAASHTYNIQVPSETTIIDRRVMWESTVRFNVSISTPGGDQTAQLPNAASILIFGQTCGFGPWPLHTLCSTQQITINNNTVSINTNDIIPALGKLGIDRELQHYNQNALTETDFYFDQSATRGLANWPMAGIDKMAQDRCYKPRGAVQSVVLSNAKINGADCNANQFKWNATTAGGVIFNTGQGAKTWTCDVTVTLTEPLICSPFLYTNPYYNGQGFYGIQNLNYVFNINGTPASGFFRLSFTAGQKNPGVISATNMTIQEFTNSKMIFNFLSPKPSDMLTARNVVPYWEMPRFTSSTAGPAAAAVVEGVIQPVSKQFTSQSLQLNQIPDKLIIFVRKSKSNRNLYDTDYAIPIKKISIQFNNQSGILASATQDQLWRFSVESGSIQTWDEFIGKGNVTPSAVGDPVVNEVPLLGSYLMLEFGRHIQITEDYYASGSLGNFNLQFRLDCEYYGSENLSAANAVEIVLITQNSGIFVTEKGQSATYTGVLTKDDVLSVSASSAVNERALQRLVGGGPRLDRILGFVDKALPVAAKLGELLPDTGFSGKLKKGLSMAEDVRSSVRGNGRAGGRVSGAGKGSAKFDLDDRLV